MRAKEFLSEYRHDITLQNMGQKFIARLMQDQSMQSLHGLKDDFLLAGPVPRLLKQIEDADPTSNKEYVQWMLRMYINNRSVRFEDIISVVPDFLAKYHRLKLRKLLPAHIRDINQYKDLTKFYNDVGNLSEPAAELTDRGDSSIYFEDGTMRVLVPHDQAAACYYGQGTRWCTAANKNNMFDHYNDSGQLFIVLPKSPRYPGEKYQLHFETQQFMDEKDVQIDLPELVERLPNLKTAFVKQAIETLNLQLLPPEKQRQAVLGAAKLVTDAKIKTLQQSTKDSLSSLVDDPANVRSEMQSNIETLESSADLTGDIAYLSRVFIQLLYRDDIEDADELAYQFNEYITTGIAALKQELHNES